MFNIHSLASLINLMKPISPLLGGPNIQDEILEPTAQELHDAAVAAREISEALEASSVAIAGGMTHQQIDIALAEASDVAPAIARIGDLQNNAPGKPE